MSRLLKCPRCGQYQEAAATGEDPEGTGYTEDLCEPCADELSSEFGPDPGMEDWEIDDGPC